MRKGNLDNAKPDLTDAAVLAANESSRHALALNVLAFVKRRVAVVSNLDTRFASVKRTVEGLNLCCPKLELACRVSFVAAEGNLGRPIREHVEDLAVGHVAHLVALEHSFASLVTCHVGNSFVDSLELWRVSQRKVGACPIGLANVAVDAIPAVLAFAGLAILTLPSLLAVRKRVAF